MNVTYHGKVYEVNDGQSIEAVTTAPKQAIEPVEFGDIAVGTRFVLVYLAMRDPSIYVKISPFRCRSEKTGAPYRERKTRLVTVVAPECDCRLRINQVCDICQPHIFGKEPQ